MARQILTENKVRKLGPGLHSDGGGLYLRVRAPTDRQRSKKIKHGARTWTYRRTRKGAGETWIKLGQFPTMSLGSAREAARPYQSDGGSPTKATLAALVREWFETMIESEWRRPEQALTYVLAVERDPVGEIKLAQLRTADLTRMLLRYKKKHGNTTANRFTQRLKQALKWAKAIGYIDTNPLEGTSAKDIGGTEEDRKRVLTDAEIRALWLADTRHRPLFRFLLLTGQRIRETQLAEWRYINTTSKRRGDIGPREWFIPAANAKSKRDHIVHLSDEALAVLRELPTDRRLAFDSVSPTAVQSWLKRWCERNDIGAHATKAEHLGRFTPHDLRRTFSTRMRRGSPLSLVVTEKCLNHVLEGILATYDSNDYLDERRAMFVEWGALVSAIASGS